MELEVFGADKDKITLWTASTKGTAVALSSYKKTWDLSNSSQKSDFQSVMANSLWIEGIAPGTAKRAVSFDLRYKQGSTTICEDKTNATVVFMRLGSAVYRELAIPGKQAVGHGALFWKGPAALSESLLDNFTIYDVLHSMGSANGPIIQSYTDIYNNPGTMPNPAHWPGCYEPAGLSYVDRLNILKSGKALEALKAAIDYPGGIAGNVLVTTSGGTDTWNGNFGDIDELRCDGLIEVIYEKPGTYISHVWGKLDSGLWCYPISTYGTLHNDQDLILMNWHDTLVPATQSGHAALSSDTGTKFTHVQYVVEPAILD